MRCPDPEERLPFQPDDPFRPDVAPWLACCTWQGSGATQTFDALGRRVHTRAEYKGEDGGVAQTSESWFTWERLCLVHEETEGELFFAEATNITTSSVETRCDEHDNPVRTDAASSTVQVFAGGPAQPISRSSSTTRFDNSYEVGRLVQAEFLSEDGTSQDVFLHYEWAGDLLASERLVELIGEETAAIIGEVAEDGQLSLESTFTWEGERLTAIDKSIEFPAWGRSATRHVYEGERWMGTDLTYFPLPEGQTTTTHKAWVYDDGRFPVAIVGTDGDTNEIEVTCE